MMNTLPIHLLDEILFRLDPKSMAKMLCTNTYIKSHISDVPNFKTEYFSRLGSSLLHDSKYGSKLLCFHPYGSCKSFRNKRPLDNECKILGSCSGLLLLSFDCLCVVNPLTNKFRFIDWDPNFGISTSIGFAVSQIDRNIQRFQIVCIIELPEPSSPDETEYRFRINTGDSWEISKTTITCRSSKLKKGKNSKAVYLNGYLHWLRKDGSIIAFNPVREEVRLIPTKFERQQSTKHLFSAAGNHLVLISVTEKEIYIHSLTTNSEWILVRQIKNTVVDQPMPLLHWNVHAYDGECLVLRTISDRGTWNNLVHSYDLRAKEWRVVGSIPEWCDANQDFFLYKPSWSSVIGLLDEKEWTRKGLPNPKPHRFTVINPGRISFVKTIMGLVNCEKLCI